MNRFWKLGMDVLLMLFYVNIAGVFYLSISPMFAKPTMTKTPAAYKEGTEHFDPIIKRYARLHGLDWRFIYAMIHVESRFKEDAVSHAGAVGLMQVMPKVGKELQFNNLHQPKENIKAGILHFSQYLKKLKGHTRIDRIQMALAAYNGGIGHIYDAKRLARDRGLDPLAWASIATVLPDLEKPEIHTQYKHGFCQGKRIVHYVEDIQKMHDHFKHTFPVIPEILSIQSKRKSQSYNTLMNAITPLRT